MSLSELASLGSFVSSVAVFISMAFLAAQIRQNNRLQMSQVQQARSGRITDRLANMIEPQMSRLIVRAERLDPTLEDHEVQSYFRMCATWYYNYEDSWLQYQAGMIDPAAWATDLAALTALAGAPGFRVAWGFIQPWHDGPFREFVAGLIKDARAQPSLDYAANWRTWADTERARLPMRE